MFNPPGSLRYSAAEQRAETTNHNTWEISQDWLMKYERLQHVVIVTSCHEITRYNGGGELLFVVGGCGALTMWL